MVQEPQRPYLLTFDQVPFAILVSKLEDIVQVTAKINAESAPEDGFFGSLIVEDKMTLFLDVYRVLEKSMPSLHEETKSASQYESSVKILYAEDSLMFRQVVSGYLKEVGYEVDTAVDGVEALAMLKTHDYDFLLSDLEMPEMGGLELIKMVRTLDKYVDIPAVALTSLQSDQDRQRGFDAGFDRYENKIQRDALLATIKELLKEKKWRA
jgi:two-component system chemotaxis sensor kinase CheA